MIKDVEGIKRDMLKGAREIIARFKPAPYVEDHREEKSAALSEYIQFILLFEQI